MELEEQTGGLMEVDYQVAAFAKDHQLQKGNACLEVAAEDDGAMWAEEEVHP